MGLTGEMTLLSSTVAHVSTSYCDPFEFQIQQSLHGINMHHVVVTDRLYQGNVRHYQQQQAISIQSRVQCTAINPRLVMPMMSPLGKTMAQQSPFLFW